MKKTAIFVISFICIVSMLVTAFSVSNNETSAEIVDLNVYDLMNAIEKEDCIESEKFILLVSSLYEKADSFMNEDFVKDIVFSDRDTSLKIVILQLASEYVKNIDYREYMDLLLDEETNFEIKQNIVTNIYLNSNESIQLLYEISKTRDSRLIFTSLRYLYLLDNQKALEIINELEKSDDIDLFQLRSILMIKGFETGCNAKRQEICNYLDFCNNIIQEYPKDEIIINSVFFSLNYIEDINVLDYLLSSSKISDDLKVYYIGQHEKLVRDYFESKNPDEKYLQTMINAVSLRPDSVFHNCLVSFFQNNADMIATGKNIDVIQKILVETSASEDVK